MCKHGYNRENYLSRELIVTIIMSESIVGWAAEYRSGDPTNRWHGGGSSLDSQEQLVVGARSGDLTGFAEIYEQYFDKVFRYAYARIGHRAEAEDLAGDVFLKALQAIGSYKPGGAPFSTWLFKIAHNLVVDLLRRRSRRPTEELDEGIPLSTPPPDDEVATQMTVEDIRKAMVGITDAQQRVISLRFAGGLSIAETAEVLRKKEGAIKALQHSAIQSLRKILQREGYEVAI